jgi:Mrp family chromosome partitioning ATPase/predicted Fe-Mo cluster-binding NifX family protein
MNNTDGCSHDHCVEDEGKLKERLAKIGHTLIVLSGKGGVGKSTVAVNLALSLALRGFRTGLLDVDLHGPSVPKLLNLSGLMLSGSDKGIKPVEYSPNLKVVSMGLLLANDDEAVIWRGPLKYSAIKQFLEDVDWGELDYLVVDCPPGTGDEPLSVAQLLQGASSGVIVTTPQAVATVDVAKCITFCKQLSLPVAGIVENMSGFVCPDCGKEIDIFSHGGGEQLATKHGMPFLGKIPLDPDIVKSGDEGRPYVYHYAKTPTAARFEEIIGRIMEGRPAPKEKNKAIDEPVNGEKGDHMKFAVPTSERKLCQHFGHCESFALIEADDAGKILTETYVDAPVHEPGLLPKWLAEKQVNCVLAGGMGASARNLFAEKGIKVVTGAQAVYPREIVEQYLKGTLQTGANTCDH